MGRRQDLYVIDPEPLSPAQEAHARAEAWLRDGALVDALRAIDEAVALAPDDPGSHWRRGQILMKTAPRSSAEVEDSIASYRNAIAVAGTSATGSWFADLAAALLEVGRDDEGVALMDVSSRSPDDDVAGHAHNWLGWYFTSRKESPEQALFHCGKAVERLTTWGTPWLTLAYVEERLGRHRDAYVHYRDAALRPCYDLAFAEERAFSLFCLLAAATLGATIVSLSPPGQVTSCALVAPRGGHLLVARRFPHGFGVNMPNGKGLPQQPHEAADAVESLVVSEEVSMTQVAWALSVAVRERLNHETALDIPQAGPDFVEVHVRSEAVYVHFDHRENGVGSYDASGRRFTLSRRTDLPGALERLLENVQHQLEVFARAPVLDERMKVFSEVLLHALQQRFEPPDGSPLDLSVWGAPTSRRYAIAWGDLRRHHEAAVISVANERITVTLGREALPLESLEVE